MEFSSFLIKEKFRLIEISQMVDLLFVNWKHGKLKKKNCREKCNRVLWSLVALVYNTMIHDLSRYEHLDLLENWFTILIFVNHFENEIVMHLSNLYLNVEFERFSGPKEHQRPSKDHLMKTPPSWKTCQHLPGHKATAIVPWKQEFRTVKSRKAVRQNVYSTDQKIQ